MMSSLPELLQKIEQVKVQKIAVKGDANAEKILAAELKDLNLQMRKFKECAADEKKKFVLKVPKVINALMMVDDDR